MPIFALFSLLSAILCWTLGIYVYSRNPKSSVNRIFALFSLSLFYWSFAEFMLRQADTFETAYLWLKISSFWPFIIALLFHFGLIFAERQKLLSNKLAYLLIYLPALLFSLVELTTNLMSGDPVKKYWGYTYVVPTESLFYWFSNSWSLLLAGAGEIILVQYYFKTTDTHKKIQAKYVAISLIIPVILGTLTDTPFAGLEGEFPESTSIALALFVIIVSYAIKKYELFRLNPVTASEHILSVMPDTLVLADPYNKIIDVNDTLGNLLGYKQNELVNKPLDLLFSNKSELADLKNRLFKEGDIRNYETKYLAKSSNEIDVSINASLVKDKNNQVAGYVITARDITERKKAEQSLRYIQERLQTLVETTDAFIWEMDSRGIYTYCSPQLRTLWGLDPKEMVGKTPFDLLPPEDREKAIQSFSAMAKSATAFRNIEARSFDAKGNIRFLEINGVPFFDAAGKLKGYWGITRDITERKKAETEKEKLQQQLFQSSKMAAIGTLSGGIAHDFNNILAAIAGNAQLIKLDASRESEPYKLSSIIERSAQRGAELTQKLLALSSRAKIVTSPAKLNDIIHELNGLLKRTIEKIITIETYLTPDLWYTKIDNTQIYQVFLNICINAKEAMIPLGGGKLIIETGNKVIFAEDQLNYPNAQPGKYVMVSISDTGIGMDKETVNRIFEPFFTTKDKSQGHGLGLAMAFGIVKGHNGFIKIYSEKGKGTCFKIYLPALDEKKIEDSRQETTIIVPTGQGVILLIDDEVSIRELGKSILERFGYKVILAQDGKEGVELYQARKDEIKLVMLDLVMPNWDGKKTLMELKKINPAVKVLIASGYSANGTLQELTDIGINGFIQKPFTIKELLNEVNKLLKEG